jgi:hypothetical protein
MRFRPAAIAAFLLSLAAIAAQASVTVLPGSDNQTTRVGAAFPNPVRIAVRDDAGNPVTGVQVRILATGVSIPVGGLSPDTYEWQLAAPTAPDGVATFPRLTGERPGSVQFTVDVLTSSGTGANLGTTTLRLNVSNDPPPGRLVDLSTSAPLPAGRPAPGALRVQVLDTAGSPVPYAVVSFRYSPDALPPDSYAAAGTFAGIAPIYVQTITDFVADAQGIASPTFTAALAKPTPRDASLGKTARGFVTATVRELTARIAYSVAPIASGAPDTLQDLWWGGMSENGWGVSVFEHPGDNELALPKLFVLLFVYDAQGNPVWYVMPSGFWTSGYGSTWRAPIYLPHGSPYYAYDAGTHGIGSIIGELELEFTGAQGIAMHYRFYGFVVPARGIGSKALTRLDFSGGPPSPRQKVDDLWWGGFAQNGWGIAVHENPGTIFSIWFTYDDNSQPTWFAMSNGSWTDANTFSGPIFKPFGPEWIGLPYDATRHRVDAVGSFSLRFAPGTPPQAATFGYSVGNRSGVENLTRVPF